MVTKLGTYLIKKGKITEQQLEQAFRAQLVFGGRIGTTLIELGFITETILGETLSEVLGVPYATRDHLQDIPPDVIGLVPPNLAAAYKVVPFRVQEKTLNLAMMTPSDLLVQDEVSFLTELRVQPWVAPEIRILEALDRYYKIPRERRFIALTGEMNLHRDREETDHRDQQEPADRPRPAASVRRNEIGLDGRPIHEPGESPFAEGACGPPAETLTGKSGPATVPSSLEEWRTPKEGDAPGAIPAPAPQPAAPSGPAAAAVAGPALVAPSPPTPATAGATRTQPLTAKPVPATLEEAADLLTRATTRDQIAQVILGFAGKVLRRTGLFILQKQQVLAWHWMNNGGPTNGIRGITVPLNSPSLFTPFRTLKTYFMGPVAPLPANRDLFAQLRAPLPRVAVILPILIQGKVAVLLYGDNDQHGMERTDLTSLQRIARKASAALEILVLKNKIRML